MKILIVRSPKLYEEPKTQQPPPLWIRGLLILTCTGVSFAHGGNDGQKGMGLIMLILIGAAPTAYALNRTMPDSATPAFIASADVRRQSVRGPCGGNAAMPSPDEARNIVGDALRDKTLNQPQVFASLSVLSADIVTQVSKLWRDLPCAGGGDAQPAQ